MSTVTKGTKPGQCWDNILESQEGDAKCISKQKCKTYENDKGPLLKKQQFAQWTPERCSHHPLEPGDSHAKPDDCPSGKQPLEWRVMHTSQQPLGSPGAVMAHPCGRESKFSLPAFGSPQSCQMHDKLHLCQLTNSWNVPNLPDSINCSTHLGYTQLPSHQKHHCSPVALFTIFWSSFIGILIRRTVYLPAELSLIIPFMTPAEIPKPHYCTREKKFDSSSVAQPSAQADLPDNFNAFNSLRILENHNVLCFRISEQRNLMWPQLLKTSM